jgi:hypothetical protein
MLTDAVLAICRKLHVDIDNSDSWKSVLSESNGFVPMWNSQILWRIRAIPQIREVFSALLGTSDLWVTIDRCHFKPPVEINRSVGIRHFLHWDGDKSESSFMRFQGVLALTDTVVNQGNFVCSPALYEEFVGSGRSAAENRRASGLFDTLSISCEAGSLIVWDYRLLHGNSANLGVLPRIAMYISMMPAGGRAALQARTSSWKTGVWPHGPSRYPGFSEPDDPQPDLSSFWSPVLGVEYSPEES